MSLIGRVMLQLAMFIVVGSLLMLLVTESGSASRIITIIALAVGLSAAAVSIFLLRLGQRQDDSPQEEP